MQMLTRVERESAPLECHAGAPIARDGLRDEGGAVCDDSTVGSAGDLRE